MHHIDPSQTGTPAGAPAPGAWWRRATLVAGAVALLAGLTLGVGLLVGEIAATLVGGTILAAALVTSAFAETVAGRLDALGGNR